MMTAAVTILDSTVKILFNDFIDVYCRCASMKFNAYLMQQVNGTHAKTTAQNLIGTMFKDEPYHCTMGMFRGFKQFFFGNITVIVNSNKSNLRSLAEVRP